MNKELKEGMYVRTKKYGIAKIIGDTNNGKFNIDKFKKDGITLRFQKIKDIVGDPSFNIIDLIEVGDYVNGILIKRIWEKNDDRIFFNTIDDNVIFQITNKTIGNIVTKEQFDSIKHEVK